MLEAKTLKEIKEKMIAEVLARHDMYESSKPKFKIVNDGKDLEDIDGQRVWVIEADDDVLAWMQDTFAEYTDYIVSRTLKGVWIETSDERIVTLLKLKWTTI